MCDTMSDVCLFLFDSNVIYRDALLVEPRMIRLKNLQQKHMNKIEELNLLELMQTIILQIRFRSA